MASGAMSVSGLRKSSQLPVAASAPAAHPAANPPLASRFDDLRAAGRAGRRDGAVV